MARISTYQNDAVLTSDDKWVGTDATTGYTRNFSVGAIASYVENNILTGDGFADAVKASETVTELSINATLLSYVNEAGETTTIDLSLYLDDTNLSRVVSGTLDAGTGIATFTRDDLTTFTIDMSSLTANLGEDNQNAFSNIVVGSDTVAADIATDTVYFEAGDNMTITATPGSDYITFSADIVEYTAGLDLVLTGTTFAHESKTRTDTTSITSPDFEDSFTVVDSISSDNGHITAINVKTVTLPAAPTGTGGGDANQNAWSTIAVSGQTSVEADTTTDTLTLVAGNNVTITTDATADSVTITAANTDTTYTGGTYISIGTNEVINHDDTNRNDTTSTDAPTFGGTFEAVTGVTTNSQGHVTSIDVSTVTIPAEADTLATVTGRGASTSTGTTFTGGVTANSLRISGGTTNQGVFTWNDTDQTVDMALDAVTIQLGQEQVVRVVNKTGANLLESEFRAVRFRAVSEGGAQGERLAVVLAQANSDINSATTIGLVTEDINNNNEGFVTISGNVNGINTTGAISYGGLETWADGDVLYLDAAHAGYLTNVKPLTPGHLIVVGYVVYAHANNGKIFVKVDNGYEIDELHDVLITSITDNEILQWNATGGYWENQTLAEAGILTAESDTLASVTGRGATTSTASTFSGGLTSSGTTTISGALNDGTSTGSANQLLKSTGTGVEWSTLTLPDGTGPLLQGIDGGGTTNYVPLWADTDTLKDSVIFQDSLATLVTVDGDLTITGDLTVSGTTTTVNSTTVDIADLNITLAANAANSAEANGGGITIGGAGATLTYASAGDKFVSNKNLEAAAFIKTGGTSSQFLKADGTVDSSTYLTSYTETDPVFVAHTSYNIANGTGFLKNDEFGAWSYDNNTYLTSYTETDTLATVTGRGATTSTASTFSGGLTSSGTLTVSSTLNDGVSVGTGGQVLTSTGTGVSWADPTGTIDGTGFANRVAVWQDSNTLTYRSITDDANSTVTIDTAGNDAWLELYGHSNGPALYMYHWDGSSSYSLISSDTSGYNILFKPNPTDANLNGSTTYPLVYNSGSGNAANAYTYMQVNASDKLKLTATEVQVLNSDLKVTAGLKDSSGGLGTNGQLLSSTGTSTSWVDAPESTNVTAVYRNTYTGDNSTTNFAVAITPTIEEQVQVYLDGIYQNNETYSLVANEIVFSTAPPTGVIIEMITIGEANITSDLITGNGTVGPYTISQTPGSANAAFVYIDGVYQNKSTYTISGTSLTFTEAVPATDEIQVIVTPTLYTGSGLDTVTTVGNTTANSITVGGATINGSLSITGTISGPAYTGVVAMASATEVDFAAGAVFTKTLSAEPTALTFANYQVGDVKTLIIDGNYTLGFGTGTTVKVSALSYDPTITNYIQVECIDSTTPKFLISYLKEQA